MQVGRLEGKDQTLWLIVPPGFSRPHRVVTHRPLVADRVTDLVFEVPGPTRSVVVVFGDRAACFVVTKRPVFALRDTDLPRAMFTSSRLFEQPRVGPMSIISQINITHRVMR